MTLEQQRQLIAQAYAHNAACDRAHGWCRALALTGSFGVAFAFAWGIWDALHCRPLTPLYVAFVSTQLVLFWAHGYCRARVLHEAEQIKAITRALEQSVLERD